MKLVSSRVLTGSDTAPAGQMVWKQVGTPAQTTAARPAGPLAAGEGQVKQLQARIAELESEMRRREEQAHEAGFRQGQAAGEERAAARLEPVVARFAQTIEQLAGQRRRLRREAEEDLLQLALAIGRRVLHRELSIDPEALLGIVQAALKKMELRDLERVRVNPADALLIRKHFEQIGIAGKVEVVAEPTFERGAAIFETGRGGALDASIETQLEEIRRGLSDRVLGGI